MSLGAEGVAAGSVEAAPARYVAIITDGNGRWAQQRGLPVVAGHEAGADTVKARLRDAAELGIEELTVYSFSTENWSRDEDEVVGADGDVRPPDRAGDARARCAEGVRMRFIGRRARAGRAGADRADGVGRGGDARQHRITLFVAFNYGGRAEIVDAARTFTGSTEEEFRAHLYAPDMHDPDLIIRTSGEQRISNYLLWQAAYSELVLPRRAVARLLARRVRGDPARSSPPVDGGSEAADVAAGVAPGPVAVRPRAGAGARQAQREGAARAAEQQTRGTAAPVASGHHGRGRAATAEEPSGRASARTSGRGCSSRFRRRSSRSSSSTSAVWPWRCS